MGISNSGRLDEILKPHTLEFDVLKEALAEVSKEDAEKKKLAAKELIRKAMELKNRMDQARNAFNKEQTRFDKELGKLLNRIKNMAVGQPADEDEEETPNSTPA
jgi:hypothetical protein